jgi:alkylation response protein AidB-like acyl-CoA dehydrogenase
MLIKSTLYYVNYIYLFYVLGLTKGKRDDKLGIRAASSCNIILDNVIVPTENMLGNEGDGFKIALSGIGELKV